VFWAAALRGWLTALPTHQRFGAFRRIHESLDRRFHEALTLAAGQFACRDIRGGGGEADAAKQENAGNA
jgi:hypothetical protein